MNWNRVKTGLIFAGILLLGIIAAVFLYAYQVFAGPKTFAPGVDIAGISVQGKNLEEASQLLTEQVDDLYQVPVVFSRDDYTYECTLKDLCLPIDSYSVVSDIWQKEDNLAFWERIRSLDGKHRRHYDLTLSYDPEVKEKLSCEWEKRFATPYTDARIEIDRVRGPVVIPGQSGWRVNLEKTYEQLPSKLSKQENVAVNLIVEPVYPQVRPEDFHNLGELAAYSTQYNPGEINRSHNLQKAVSSINGTTIKENEIFSFNKTVGSRSSATGYRDAMVVVGDKFEPGIGGGICQVSSTLYNTVLLAGMDIVERYNHALSVTYVPLGRDATVVYGVQDFRFRNNTDSPIYIKANASGGTLSIRIYGNTHYKQNIKLYSVVDKTIPFQTITKPDPELAPGQQIIEHRGFPGYVVRAFRQYLDGNGKVAKTESLGTDRYRPLNKLIKVGPGSASAPPSDIPVTPGAPANPEVPGPEPEPGTGLPADMPVEGPPPLVTP